MAFTVLGSGGNTPTPPTCDCQVRAEARRDIPYARRGNGIYRHDEHALIDAPELVRETLDRERIAEAEYVVPSHFHADQTLGLGRSRPSGSSSPFRIRSQPEARFSEA